MKVVVLWSDALLFLLLALVFAGGWWSRRQAHLRDAWQKVGASGTAMAAATVLAAFLVIGVLDSLHYRERLPDTGKGPGGLLERGALGARRAAAAAEVAHREDLLGAAGDAPVRQGIAGR